MSGRAGPLPLLIAVGLFAAAAAALVVARPPGDPPLRLGAEAPVFELADLGGHSLSLAELRGHVVFVNFWGTWCAPCRDEAPSLERLYRELRGEGLEVVAVSIDDAAAREEVGAFRDEFELSVPILLDPDRRIRRRPSSSRPIGCSRSRRSRGASSSDCAQRPRPPRRCRSSRARPRGFPRPRAPPSLPTAIRVPTGWEVRRPSYSPTGSRRTVRG